MAIYDTGTASLAANGQVTGVGTQWTMPLTLIRVGATLVFKTEPVQIYTISEITSDTSMAVYNPNGETVPAGTGYAILAHDGISVQGLAQDVAETLRYYQSRETEVADAVDAFNNFDFADFESKVTQVNTHHGEVVSIGAQVSSDAAQVSQDKQSSELSASSASVSAQHAAASAASVSGALIGTFQDGVTVESKSQQVINISNGYASSYLWGGELPKVVPAGSTPEDTGGIGPQGWIPLASSGDAGFDSIYELIQQPTENKTLANVRSYISGSNSGGGLFYWSPSVSKGEHNGITVFSPTVPFDGTYSTLSDFLGGVGEPSPVGNGCWVRFTGGIDDIHTEWAGHDVSGVNESNASVMACINLGHNTNRKVRISAGRLKVSFSTDIQYNDKYNVLRKTAFFLNGLNVDIFANNDVEIDISGSSSPERVVFGAKNCTLKASGLNWNSDFSDYSIQPLDTTHKPREDWFGFMVEGCASVVIERMEVNASRAFVNADALNGLSNALVSLRDSSFRYNANYCLLTRNCDYSEFIGNTTKQSGRVWHTFAEDYAISEKSKRSYAHANKFYYPISIQSRITPAGNNITVTDNYYEGSGIFVEVFAANNVICKGNTSIITTDATGRASSHYLLITNDSTNDWGVNEGLSNILIADNIMIGGGIAVQGYNEGTQIKNGLIITGNTMTDTKAPYLTNQSWIGAIFSNNSCKFTPGFGELSIGGQNPTIKDNILDGGFIQLRVGYEVISPTYEGNKFRNTVGASLNTMFDMDNFTGGVFRNNDFRASSFSDIFPLNDNVTKVGFRYVDYGFSARPTDKYGEKCVIRAGDFILNDNPTTYGSAYAWFGATNGAYLQVNTAS